MWLELRYRRRDTTIRFVNSDIRVPREWSVQMNGRLLSTLVGDFEEWLVEVLHQLNRQL